MNETILITPTDKSKRVILKEKDGSCEVELFRRGIFSGTITRLFSNGNIEIKLKERLEEK